MIALMRFNSARPPSRRRPEPLISTRTEKLEIRRPLRQRMNDGMRAVVAPVIRFLVRHGVGPNTVTVAGFAGSVAVCALILERQWLAAGFVFVAAGMMDLLDGSVARLSGRATPFGAFLDSTLDRTAEGLVLGAIGVVLAKDGHWWALGAAFAALTASFLVSYTRARAEGLGIDSNRGGLMARPERLVLIGAGIFFAPLGATLQVVIFVLAGLTLLTVAQRVLFVWRATRAEANRPGGLDS